MIPELRNLSYPDRLKVLDIPSMAYRRIRGDMIEVYKIFNNGYDGEVTLHLERNEGPTRGNNKKLTKNRCRTTRRQMFFTSRVVDVWNSLPDSVIDAPSLLSFERKLDKFWKNQPIKFDFEEALVTTLNHRIRLSLDEDLDIED